MCHVVALSRHDLLVDGTLGLHGQMLPALRCTSKKVGRGKVHGDEGGGDSQPLLPALMNMNKLR